MIRIAVYIICLAFAFLPLGCAWAQLNNGGQELKTLTPDTTRAKIKVKRKTIAIRPDQIRYGRTQGDTLKYSFAELHLWDETDTLKGFKQVLGQIGRPYRRYLYGVSDYYLPTNLYRNPISGEANVYILDAYTQLPFYDTRTPYVNAHFDQSRRQIQLFRADISQNIGPFWNTTLRYRRRSGQNAYPGGGVSHYNISGSMHFRTRNYRYQAFVAFAFNELGDELHGGVAVDSATQYNQMFNKFSGSMALNGSPYPRLTQRVKTFTATQFVNVVRDSSYLTTAYLRFTWNGHYRWFNDPNLYGINDFDNQLFTPYRQYNSTDSTKKISESYRTSQVNVMAGARNRIKLGPLSWQNQYEFSINVLSVDQMLTIRRQTKQSHRALSEIFLPLKKGQFLAAADLQFTTNNLLKPEVLVAVRVAANFPTRDYDIMDSSAVDTNYKKRRRWHQSTPVRFHGSYNPVQVNGKLHIFNQNPSLLNAFWNGITFKGNPLLNNENLFLIAGDITYTGKPKIRRGVPFLQSYYRVGGFWSRQQNQVYYDSHLNVLQASGKDYLQRIGVEVAFRQRFSRFYIENEITLQRSNAGSAGLQQYAKSLPWLSGKGSFYYDNRVPRTPMFVRLGIDVLYYTGYQGLAFEPGVQAFYPQGNFKFKGYARMDIYAAARVKWVSFYVKLLNLNEGFWMPGNFTTPYYPMLERSFCFGVDWTFFN